MKTSILICITLACLALNLAEANEQAAPGQAVDPKIYGWTIRLPGIYKPPPPVPPTCTNDKTGCPAGDTCTAGNCVTAGTPAAKCASATACPSTCAATACTLCVVAC